MKKSKYEKKELTKFLVKRLANKLEPELEKIHFIPPKIEKKFPGSHRWYRIFFDIWSQRRGEKKSFAIWEIEIKQQSVNNILKLEEILNWRWKPKIFIFQIYSPDISKSTKKYCNDEVKKLKREHKNQIVYKPIDIKISKNRFARILERFQKDKYSAKAYYEKELEREIKRITMVSIKKLSMMNK